MKRRLDTILVERGFFSSRSQAAAAVLAGEVSVKGQPVTKAGTMVAPDVEIALREAQRFVSRGGLKLETAFERFNLDVTGAVALDAGASTGGFTDCMLQHGARKVIAVDVGYGQLDWKLRNDPRVEVHERTNIRGITPELLSEAPNFATFDLSFISLKKVLPPVIKCLKPGFELVALVKPQFEAGKGKVGSGGVVRDAETHRQVLNDIWQFAESQGLIVLGLTESGIRGPKGNVEFLIHLADGRKRPEAPQPIEAESVIYALIEGLAER
ncbi:MAG: TlyA family RNA methyltransferase [Thermoleophilia bacterium]|nr:TlyA family RNA methyltransferase [Thermoleophilia bacterium]